MANGNANMSDEMIRSPVRTSGKLLGEERERHRSRSVPQEPRGGERERRRSRSRSRGRRGYSRSTERRRPRQRSQRPRSQERRRWSRGRSHRSSRDDKWRPRARSPAMRDRLLSTPGTTSSAPQVVSATQLHLSFSEHHLKLKNYDHRDDDVSLAASAPKAKQQRMGETFDEYDSHQHKRQKPLDSLNVDILKHQSIPSFVDQSTEVFMDVDDVLASATNLTTTTKPLKNVSFTTQETPPHMTMGQGIHPDRMRRLSNDANMDADDNIITSYTFRAPKQPRSGSGGSNANLIPVGKRRWKADIAKPATQSIPAVSLAQDNNGLAAPTISALLSQPTVAASYPSAQYDDIFAEPYDGASMQPPPLSGAPSYNRILSSPTTRPNSPVLQAGPPRTRQQIYDDYIVECDKIEKGDAERWDHQGTIKYQVSDEEVEVILARMSFNAGPVAYATREFWSKPGQPVLKHKEDRIFIPDPANPRLNEKGFPLTQYDEGKTTFDRLLETQGKAITLIRKTKPGPNESPIVFRSQKAGMLRDTRRKKSEDEKKANLNSEYSVGHASPLQPAVAAASSAEESETAAIASLSELTVQNVLDDL